MDKNKMRIIISISIFFFIANIGLSQNFNDSLYLHLYNFHIIKGELKKEDISFNDLSKSFNIQELVAGTNTCSFKIYKFYNLKYEEVNTSILVIDDKNYEIYDILSFSYLINKILDVDFDCAKKKFWIKEILKLLDEYKSIDLGSAVFEKEIKGFKYYIPLKNLKNETEIK